MRKPVFLSYNSWFNDTNNPGRGNARGGINKMMDGTEIPQGVGDERICLFCHQGRESGYTLYRVMLSKGVDPYANPAGTLTNTSYTNAHYYSGGAALWSRNSWEYVFDGVPQTYSEGIPAHQQKNCTGCHMAPASKTIRPAATPGSPGSRPATSATPASPTSSRCQLPTTSTATPPPSW
ncbi:MAG TPA: hypothetical protein VNO81_13000 [Candidatus Nitrosotenuis sp.]|nr:hypothetical protein [Candidatus Nitrosotenuis sp.]